MYNLVHKILFARAERFELPSTVLETAILPLNYARKNQKSPVVRKFLLTNDF